MRVRLPWLVALLAAGYVNGHVTQNNVGVPTRLRLNKVTQHRGSAPAPSSTEGSSTRQPIDQDEPDEAKLARKFADVLAHAHLKTLAPSPRTAPPTPSIRARKFAGLISKLPPQIRAQLSTHSVSFKTFMKKMHELILHVGMKDAMKVLMHGPPTPAPVMPTPYPTYQPTGAPTQFPTQFPTTIAPTYAPTAGPTRYPTLQPTLAPVTINWNNGDVVNQFSKLEMEKGLFAYTPAPTPRSYSPTPFPTPSRSPTSVPTPMYTPKAGPAGTSEGMQSSSFLNEFHHMEKLTVDSEAPPPTPAPTPPTTAPPTPAATSFEQLMLAAAEGKVGSLDNPTQRPTPWQAQYAKSKPVNSDLVFNKLMNGQGVFGGHYHHDINYDGN